MHGLLHLPEVVENLGPLWAHSCFPFESANGDLLKYFHGSSGVEKQVCICTTHMHNCLISMHIINKHSIISLISITISNFHLGHRSH